MVLTFFDVFNTGGTCIAKGGREMLQVIFHMNDNQRWQMLISNIKNLKEWLSISEEKGEVEILLNGEAVEMALQHSSMALSETFGLNIKIAVCQNSLNSRGYTSEMLQEGCDIVPVGVVELAQKQNAGFAYIKP